MPKSKKVGVVEFMSSEKTSKAVSWHEETCMYVRGEGDVGVIKEQVSCYKKIMDPTLYPKGSWFLDIGGHIGAFARMMAETRVKMVSVEPDPNNIRVFKKNQGQGNKLIEGAVTMVQAKTVPLYLGKTYPATNSVEKFRGRIEIQVKAVDWKKLLASKEWYGIKCDIEGGEYGLDWKLLPKSVKVLAIEFHFNRKVWVDEMERIRENLNSLGFAEIRKPKDNNFRKISMGIYTRIQQ